MSFLNSKSCYQITFIFSVWEKKYLKNNKSLLRLFFYYYYLEPYYYYPTADFFDFNYSWSQETKLTFSLTDKTHSLWTLLSYYTRFNYFSISVNPFLLITWWRNIFFFFLESSLRMTRKTPVANVAVYFICMCSNTINYITTNQFELITSNCNIKYLI